jgi:hypothetical protein
MSTALSTEIRALGASPASLQIVRSVVTKNNLRGPAQRVNKELTER